MTFIIATNCGRDEPARAKLCDVFCGAALLELLVGPSLIPAVASLSVGTLRNSFGSQLRPSVWDGLSWNDFAIAACVMAVGFRLSMAPGRHGDESFTAWPVAKAFGVALFLLTVATFCSYPNHIFSFHCQLSGLLQRLAICHLVCSAIHYWLPRIARIVVGSAILIGYWIILDAIPVPGSDSSDFTFESNLAAWVDERFLPGSVFFGRWDPDGILTTFPAIGTCLIGVLWGDLIRSRCSAQTKMLALIVGGLISLSVGFLAEAEMPINRILWTPTFVLVSAGCCSVLLAAFYYILQVAQKKQWCFPLSVLGRNFFVTILFLDLTPIGRVVAGHVGDRMSLSCHDYAPFLQAVFEIISNWLILFWLCHFEDSFQQYRQLRTPQLLRET